MIPRTRVPRATGNRGAPVARGLVGALAIIASWTCAAAESSVSFRGVAVPDRSGTVMTVEGPADPAGLGFTLPHEHVFIDLAAPFGTRLPGPADDAERRRFERPFTTEQATALLPQAFTGNRDALVLDDPAVAIRELELFRDAGGGTLVDLTTSVGRNPAGLVDVARRSGVRIVMGTGFYRTAWHPPDLPQRSIDDLVEQMVREIVDGERESGVRAGIIGEISAEDLRRDPDSDEVRVLRAAARAARLTGAAVSLHSHIGRPEKWHVAVDILLHEGLDPARIVVGHVTGVDVGFVESLLRRGVYVQFDTLGAPFFASLPALDTRPNLDVILELVRRGHAERLLLSQDVCTKFQLRRHGGAGYTFVPLHVVPWLRSKGVAESSIRRIVERNPADVLTFRAPQGPGPAGTPAR